MAKALRLTSAAQGHGRCVSGLIQGVEVQNFYIPAGGDIPDRKLNRSSITRWTSMSA